MADNEQKYFLDNAKANYENGNSGNNKSAEQSQIDLLNSIDATLKDLLKNGVKTSQSNAKNDVPKGNFDVKNIFRDTKKMKADFENEFKSGIKDALGVGDLKKSLKGPLEGLSQQLGVEIQDLPGTLGKHLGKDLINSLGNSKVAGPIVKGIQGTIGDISSAAASGVTKMTSVIAEGGSVLQGGLAGLGEVALAAGPQILALGAAVAVVAIGMAALGPAIEGTKELFSAMGKSFNRYNEQQEQYVKAQKDRLEADVKTLIEKPFELLTEAATEVYNSWDNVVRVINGTQGYSKADLQNLYANYAQRLTQEGLDKVISSSSIITNLEDILKSGLTGKAAEEFAYLATKLNAAIPTQDFFGYADTYASLAANAIKSGQSQTEAIQYANQQLEAFASDVLYASRQLSGGFSSGLKNAQSLFEQSVKISQASKTGIPSNIAGTLTSISAIVGAIAPDLADSIVSTVYDAAVGGNSSSIVALRSLAGINAANTEFLQQLANDPKGVFSALFSRLGQLQNMSQSNYMEVAEGLSNVFGLSQETFQRVDFNYLAEQINKMNTNNSSLEENIKQLASGETTTTTEQLKIQQINKYMLDEGLAYVLDNEAARAIQQHMWDEQLAREITESTFAVELQGAALTFLEGIRHTIDNIIGLLNPLSWIKRGVTELVATQVEVAAQQADIKQVLELGKVGSGNSTALYQLTTTGENLRLTTELVNLMGGTSRYGLVSGARELFELTNNMTNNPTLSAIRMLSNAGEYKALASSVLGNLKSSLISATGYERKVGSNYTWGSISKSAASAITNIPSGYSTGGTSAAVDSGTSASSVDNSRIKSMLDEIEKYATEKDDSGNYKYSYDDWASTSRKYGIANLETALKDAGYELEAVKQQYTDYQTKAAAEEEVARRTKEELSWDNINNYLPYMDDILDKITNIDKLMEDFVNKWIDRYVEFTTYQNSTRYTSSDIERIRQEEKKGSDDLAAALADSLTSNLVDIKDPTIQTNVLLAEILKVMSTIMQQNNNKTTSEQLADSLRGLALGL